MKKLIYLLITLSVLIILSACVKISVTPPDSDIKNNIPQTSSVDTTSSAENTDAKDTEKIEAPVTTKAPETTKTPETAKSDYDFPTQSGNEALTRVTISERVMVDENGVKITLKGIDFDSSSSPRLKFSIENNTALDLKISTKNVVVNNCMMDNNLFTTVAAGKKANDYISIDQLELQLCNISTIATIDLAFDISDNNYNTILSTDFIKIETSAANGFVYTYDDSGILLYDKNNIKIVSKYLYKESKYSNTPSLLLYINNASDEYISIRTQDFSINGYMVTSSLFADVLPNTHAFSGIRFFSSDFEENDITKIEEIEFKLYISDRDTYKTIDKTDNISLKVSEFSLENGDEQDMGQSSSNYSIYKDDEINLMLTVPQNWEKGTLSKEYDTIVAKFISKKDYTYTITYGREYSLDDAYTVDSLISLLEYKSDYSDFLTDFLSDMLPKSTTATVAYSINKVYSKNYNGHNYLMIESTLQSPVTDTNYIKVTTTTAFFTYNGWISAFTFTGTSKSNYFSDFESLLNSVYIQNN